MINAKEAKELYDASGAEVTDYLTHNVEKYIKEAAESGKRTYIIHLGAEELWTQIHPTNLQKKIMVALGDLGYIVKFSSYGDQYVPRSFGNGDGDGPLHQNYGIHIGW